MFTNFFRARDAPNPVLTIRGGRAANPKGSSRLLRLLVFMNNDPSLLRFDAFQVSLQLVRGVRSLLPGIRKHSASLARQLTDAACSVPLNVAEGRRRIGRDRPHLWRVASGSAEECRAILYTAEAMGYLEMSEIRSTLEFIDRVLAMLWRMTEGKRKSA